MHQVYTAKTPTYKARTVISDNDNPIYVNLNKPIDQSKSKETITKPDGKTLNNITQRVPRSNDHSIGKTHRKLEATKSNTSQDTDSKVLPKKRQINEVKNTATLEKKNQSVKQNTDKRQPDRGDKSDHSRQKTHFKVSNEHAFDSSTNKSSESKNSYKQTNSNKKEHKSRSLRRDSKPAPEDVKMERVTTSQSTKDSADKSSGSNVKVHKRQSSKDHTSTRNDIPTIIPKVGTNSSANKNTYNKDQTTRHGSRPSRREYVINYDDKNGTVSSICKIRSASDSPRRKKTTKEAVKEKFKENLKNKSSDKAALRK